MLYYKVSISDAGVNIENVEKTVPININPDYEPIFAASIEAASINQCVDALIEACNNAVENINPVEIIENPDIIDAVKEPFNQSIDWLNGKMPVNAIPINSDVILKIFAESFGIIPKTTLIGFNALYDALTEYHKIVFDESTQKAKTAAREKAMTALNNLFNAILKMIPAEKYSEIPGFTYAEFKKFTAETAGKVRKDAVSYIWKKASKREVLDKTLMYIVWKLQGAIIHK